MSGDNQPQVPNDVLIKIYEQFGDLRSDVSATKTATEANSLRLDALMGRFDELDSRVKILSEKESRNSLRWSIATFLATTLIVSGVNYAVGDDEQRNMTALPPSAKEILSDTLWEDNENRTDP